ncbi:MAG: SlyX family protein [Pseudomonadota bacterium]|nr:SlyX family protein [Pseudomonadota bacterium]
MNETIMDLQTRLAFQEDSIDAINQIVVRQQSEIDLLKREIIQLKRIVDDFRDSQGDSVNVTELPPHY